MAGVAGASIGLVVGSQSNIAAAQAKVDGTTTARGCTTNFIGFGFGLTSEELDPADFNATDDTVIRSTAGAGTVQVPTYVAVAGSSPPRSTLSWTAGAAPAVPTNSVAPTITGTAQVGQVLTAVNGTWAGTPTPTFTYVWLVGGVAQGTAGTYTCRSADVGKTVVCQVTGANAAGSRAVNTAATAAVIP
jgi:hypothetical protein